MISKSKLDNSRFGDRTEEILLFPCMLQLGKYNQIYTHTHYGPRSRKLEMHLTLKERREKGDLITIHKLVNNLEEKIENI